MPLDSSQYLRTKNCCKKIVEVCTPGPQGPPGPSIQTAYLIYNDISFNIAGSAPLVLDTIKSQNNGIIKFIDTNGYINFSDLSNCLVEIYSHCDATADNTGTDNFVTIDLSAISYEPNSLSIVDIDTRSVSKGDEAHLSFGPSMYKVLSNTNLNNNLCINNSNKYVLRITTGRRYEIKELKLIIKVIYY